MNKDLMPGEFVVSLVTLNQGAAPIMFDSALEKVLENIADQNTAPNAKREIKLTVTRFQRTPEAEAILKFLSNVKDSASLSTEDDGYGQSVTAKAGVASYAQVSVPSPVRLIPLRTFIEVPQPPSDFILRLKGVKDQLPQVALFEIPSNWQREAAVNVKQFLDAGMAEWLEADRIPVFA